MLLNRGDLLIMGQILHLIPLVQGSSQFLMTFPAVPASTLGNFARTNESLKFLFRRLAISGASGKTVFSLSVVPMMFQCFLSIFPKFGFVGLCVITNGTLGIGLNN